MSQERVCRHGRRPGKTCTLRPASPRTDTALLAVCRNLATGLELGLPVGNHTIYGLLDVPLMVAEIWKGRRIAVRSLGEHAHYAVPVWRTS